MKDLSYEQLQYALRNLDEPANFGTLANFKTKQALLNYLLGHGFNEQQIRAAATPTDSPRPKHIAERSSATLMAHLVDDLVYPIERLPKQAQVIVRTLQDHGGSLHLFKLIRILEQGNKLNTKQPVERVFNHYRKRLIEDGYLEIRHHG